MTREEVKQRVEAIRAIADDDERAHGMEDDLHAAVLKTIANGAENAADLAAAALETIKISFARWCA